MVCISILHLKMQLSLHTSKDMQSIDTFISNIHIIQIYHIISISIQPGVQKTTAYLSSRKANWSIMVCFSMSLWNYARLMWSCWRDWFTTVHGGTVSMWEMSMPLKGAWTRTKMKRFESGTAFLEGALVICCFKGLKTYDSIQSYDNMIYEVYYLLLYIISFMPFWSNPDTETLLVPNLVLTCGVLEFMPPPNHCKYEDNHPPKPHFFMNICPVLES